MYVFYKEDNSHNEVYVVHILNGKVVTTKNVGEALSFKTAAEAYRFGGALAPLLDWWHVGDLQNGRTKKAG